MTQRAFEVIEHEDVEPSPRKSAWMTRKARKGWQDVPSLCDSLDLPEGLMIAYEAASNVHAHGRLEWSTCSYTLGVQRSLVPRSGGELKTEY